MSIFSKIFPNFLIRRRYYRKLAISGSEIQKTEEEKSVDKNLVKSVERAMNCSFQEAEQFCKNTEIFLDGKEDKIQILCEIRKLGVTLDTLKDNLDVLLVPKETMLQRVKITQDIFVNNDDPSVPLYALRLDKSDYNCFLNLVLNKKNKAEALSIILQLPVNEVYKYFVKYKFLLRSRISTIKTKVEFLVDSGVCIDEVKKDLWVLTYTIDRLKSRIQLAKELKLEPIKPWMLRCEEDVVKRTSAFREQDKLALVPYLNSIHFLCERLQISENQISKFAARHPPVMKVHVFKMAKIIDYLLYEGFTNHQIYLTPRVLCHSLKTLESRMDDLKQRNYKPASLSVLCKSKKKFTDFLQFLDCKKGPSC